MQDDKGFLGSLFDLSFDHFITTKIIKLLYIIFMILIGIVCLVLIVSGFLKSIPGGIVMLILSPIIYVLYLCFIRIWLELVMVIFRIANDVEAIKQSKQITQP